MSKGDRSSVMLLSQVERGGSEISPVLRSSVASKSIWFAYAVPSIQALCLNNEKRRDFIVSLGESAVCSVIQRTSASLTKLFRRILIIRRMHHIKERKGKC